MSDSTYLLTTIRSEDDTTFHTNEVIEIQLKISEFPRPKRGKKKQNEVKPFDLDSHMKNYYSSSDELITKDNDDNPQLFLINCH
jgi:hypothetical protein